MKKSNLFKHLPLLYFAFITLIQTIGARWIANAIPIARFAQIVAVLAYLPCAIFVLWLLYLDIQGFRKKKLSLFSCLYYLFAVYYVCLCAGRLLTSGQFKDGTYYVIVLYGAIALIELILRGNIPADKDTLTFDICVYSLGLCLYRLVWILVKPFANGNIMPINEIAMGAVLLFALVIGANALRASNHKPTRIIASLSIMGTVVVILTLSSRIMFLGLCVELIALLVLFLLDKNSRKYVKQFLILIACGIVIVAILAVADVGDVRYSLYRATSIQIGSTAPMPDVPVNDSQQAAQDQIEKSDSLRKRLNDFGLREVKKNLFFGTGNVYLEITDFGYVARVPVHNGILQMLVSFGLVGTLMVLAMVAVWIWSNRPHKRPVLGPNMLNLLLLVGLYCVFAMVQATSFDHMVLPSGLICACVFLQRDSKEI